MPGGYGSPGENSGLIGAEGGAIPERMKDGGTVQNMKRGGKVRQMKSNGKPGSSQPANTPPQGRPTTPPGPTPPTQGGPYGNPMGGDQPGAIPDGAPSPGFKGGGNVNPTGYDPWAYINGEQTTDARQPDPPALPAQGGYNSAQGSYGSYSASGKKTKKTKGPPPPSPSDSDTPQAPSATGKALGAPTLGTAATQQALFDDGGDVPDTADAPVDADQGQEGQAGDPSQQQSGPPPSVQKALTAARSQFGLNDNIFNNMQMSDNQNDPRPIPPSPNGPVKPFNPRDFLPGGSKASDNGIPQETETG
jgi:hypothetical protein